MGIGGGESGFLVLVVGGVVQVCDYVVVLVGIVLVKVVGVYVLQQVLQVYYVVY